MNANTSKKYGSRTYTYNREQALMEWNDEEIGNLYSVGLSRENFDESPEYWFDRFHQEIEEELQYMW